MGAGQASLYEILGRVLSSGVDRRLEEAAAGWERLLVDAEAPLELNSFLGLLVTSDGVTSTFEFEWGPLEEVYDLPGADEGELEVADDESFTMHFVVGVQGPTRPVNPLATHVGGSPWLSRRYSHDLQLDAVYGDVIFAGYADGNDDGFLRGLQGCHLDGICRVALALAESCPPDVLALLADQARADEPTSVVDTGRGKVTVKESWNRLTRLAVAKNLAAPESALRMLAVDDEVAVRDAVRANPSASDEVRALAALR